MIGVGHTPGCFQGADPIPYLRIYGASIMRVIVNPGTGQDGSALQCIQTAVAAGYKVHLDIQWWNQSTLSSDSQWFHDALTMYGRYAWAISIGNEQELTQGVGTETGAQYAAVWRTVEPMVASMAPQAFRVAGEVSPWGLGFLSEAVRAGLPGVQAFSAHPYHMPNGATVGAFLAFAVTWHLPMWFTEGLMGPDSWGGAADISLSQMAGAPVGDTWLN